MAAVGAGTGAMSSLLAKLSTLLSDEYKLLRRVRKEIEFLKRELGTMHALLETLADMEKLDPTAKDWKGNVRDLSYDVEDCIDRFMGSLGSGDAKRGFMKKTARRLKTLWARHDIATQIKDLKARVVEESERRDRYKLEDYRPQKTVEIDPRLAALHEEVKGLVAISGPMERTISWLKDDKVVELKVMAIVGSGGLGKTTLAMEVYPRIIATTRSTSVANSCCSKSSNQLYPMAPLDEVESRRLFFKRTFRSDNPCPAELEEVCTRILKKCGGLPLAIITIVSLLATKSHDKDEWERLQESIGVGSSLQSDKNLKGIEDIPLLSYWDLRHHLKTCLSRPYSIFVR